MMKKRKKQHKQQRLQEDQTQTTHEPRRSQWRKNNKGSKTIKPWRLNLNNEDQTQTAEIKPKQRRSFPNNED